MSEYTYDIDKYTIGVDENGEDGIGMTVAKIENGELHFLGNCYGENARCIDLLIKENQSFKKENKILRENAENNNKVVDKVNWENQLLKKENKQLKEIIKENTILVKDEYGDYQECNIKPLEMKQKYEKLKDNWNKLREWIVYNKHNENTEQHYLVVDYGTLLGKMQELEINDK